MKIYEILDYNIKALNIDHLINSITRSSIVLILGLICLIILYHILPQKIEKMTADDLNSLSNRENFPLVLGIVGFFILGTTGYAYAISRLLNILYSPVASLWVNVSFLLITALCFYCYRKIKFGLVPILIGWTSALGGIISLILVNINVTLEFIIETIILSFLICVGIWFLHIKMSNYAQKITITFGVFLTFYSTIKLFYFLLFISQITVGFLDFLYNLSPSLLDIICIFGPVTICFLKCRND